MTIHLTIWWLWWPLIGVYIAGILAGMFMSMFSGDTQWWVRPLILIWPLTLAGLTLWHFALFMIGRE